jgi:uncharacterized membrane protein
MLSSASPFRRAAAALETKGVLDEPARPVRALGKLLSPAPVKAALSGKWLGHALHPIMTDLVIGSFVSASMLDFLGGDDSETGAERLLAIGIASYAPTALSGMSDWADRADSDPRARRVGIVHAATNAVALSLYGASLASRRGGSQQRGKLLALAGGAALGAGGYLGGHLAYVQGVGVEPPGTQTGL